MHRLSGEDAGFLSMELPEQPMNTMAVAILDRADGPPLTVVPLEEAFIAMVRKGS